MSLRNTVAGLGLAALSGLSTAVPVCVVGPAPAIATHGVFTLAWLARPRRPRRTEHLGSIGGAGLTGSGDLSLALRSLR